jgi:hypothetical protein
VLFKKEQRDLSRCGTTNVLQRAVFRRSRSCFGTVCTSTEVHGRSEIRSLNTRRWSCLVCKKCQVCSMMRRDARERRGMKENERRGAGAISRSHRKLPLSDSGSASKRDCQTVCNCGAGANGTKYWTINVLMFREPDECTSRDSRRMLQSQRSLPVTLLQAQPRVLSCSLDSFLPILQKEKSLLVEL